MRVKTAAAQKMKRAAAYAMIAFALASLFVAARDIGGGSAFAGKTGGPAMRGEPDGLYVVLFRGSSYCPTCDLMEELSEELLGGPASPFAQDVGDGALSFRTVNFEKPGNEHYLFDYDLYTTTIVLIEQKDGSQSRWVNLQESWKHAEETGDFKEYLTAQIHDFQRKGALKNEH